MVLVREARGRLRWPGFRATLVVLSTVRPPSVAVTAAGC